MKTRRTSFLAALATLTGAGAHAQAAAPAGGGISFGTLLLVAIGVGVLYLVLRRRRPPEDLAPPPNPYARDDAFGRSPYGPGPDAGPDPYAGMQPPAQGGMGSSIARGVATGLAVGAGAVVAQEFGRRLFEHGPDAAVPGAPDHAASSADHAANVHSPLAHDAGLDALDGSRVQGLAGDLGGPDFGLGGDTGWDDAGAGPGDDDWDA